jgi:putative ABC transport system permease protein
MRAARRAIRQRPAAAAAVVLTLALGVGANSAIFSVVSAVLFRPLPFHHPDRLVVVWESNPARGTPLSSVSAPNLADWRASDSGFDDLGAFSMLSVTWLAPTGAERVRLVQMTPNLPSVLGVGAALGRTLTEADGRPDAPPAIVLADAFWRLHFGADPGVVGRTMPLGGGRTYEIVGVMPASFAFPPPVSFEPIKRPVMADAFVAAGTARLAPRNARYLTVIGRLAADQTRALAEARLNVVAARLAADHPETNAGYGVRVVSLLDEIVGDVRPALAMVWAAAGLVLLLACANTAQLLLARAVERDREVTLRVALGAGRWRLARQFLIEGLALAVLATAAGLALAYWMLRVLVAAAPAALPRAGEIRLDGKTLAAAIAAAAVAILLSSLLPMMHAWRVSYGAASHGRAATASGAVRSFRRGIVVAEAAIAALLVVLAVLLGRSLLQLRAVDPGFRPDRLVMFHLNLFGPGYSDVPGFVDRMLATLNALPGVESIGTIDAAPLEDDRQGTSFVLDGMPAGPADPPAVNFSFVSPGYFETLGIALGDGRTFTGADRIGTEPVVVVNEAFARQYAAGRGVGRRLRIAIGDDPWRTVIGVVADERHESIGAPPRPAVYLPLYQVPWPQQSVFVRTTLPVETMMASVRSAIRRLDPALPIYDVKRVTDVVAASMATSTFTTRLIVMFAALALALAVVGVFAVASHGVASRTREFGVRVALGATPRDLRRAVVRPMMLLVMAGAAVGLAAGAAAGRMVESLLFSTRPVDAIPHLLAASIVVVSCVAATWRPARSAARLDTMRTLRD